MFLATGQDDCLVQGECQKGIEINLLEANTYSECQSLCQDAPNCNYFTFYASMNLCKTALQLH